MEHIYLVHAGERPIKSVQCKHLEDRRAQSAGREEKRCFIINVLRDVMDESGNSFYAPVQSLESTFGKGVLAD